MNTRKEIKLYNLDLTGKSKLNKVDFEYNKRSTAKHNDIFVVRGGPFYKESFRLLNMQGLAYTYGKDYEFYGHMSKLTEYTGKEVGLFVRLKNKNITEWQTMYQVVGNFGVVGSEILKMMISITEDDRLIDWNDIENKPLWFDPLPHIHDLTYEIFNFSDLTDQLYRIIGTLQDGPQIDTILLAKIQDQIQFYCEQYKAKFREIIASHDSSRLNNHGVNKEDIGLGLVDNFPISTVEEALDGTAQNRFLTPQLANRVITEASGRNDLLYPGGSLPMLRYGSDSFIPPKIDGSFEGMGATTQRLGAVVEPSGELLVLTARTNGITKGLYFSSCKDWDTPKCKWTFTGYQYKHPTITADGATLDFIMNGSNKYYMIVGDSVKKYFYGIETNGTLDPTKHTVKRLTGTWLSELRNIENTVLLADENYKTQICIFQSLNNGECISLRPSFGTDVDTNYGSRVNDGYLFYVIRNNSSLVEACTVSFTAWDGTVYNERLFTPYVRKMVGTGNNKKISAFTADYINNQPIRIWNYYALDASWKFNKTTGKNDFIFLIRVWLEFEDGTWTNWHVKFRSTINISPGNNPILTLETKPYETRRFTFDPKTESPAAEYNAYLADKTVGLSYPTGMYQGTGMSDLKNGYRVLFNFSGDKLPNNILIHKLSTYVDKNFMEPGYIDTWDVISGVWGLEINPIGLGTGFLNQAYISADTDDYRNGGIIARQKSPTKLGEEWIFRKYDFIRSDWGHLPPSNTVVIDGKTCLAFGYENETRKINLGLQTILCFNTLSPATVNDGQKVRYQRLFGADAWSTLLGVENIEQAVSGDEEALKYGDGLLIDKAEIKTINNVINIKPKIVFNLRKAIAGPIKDMFTAAGLSTNTLLSGWTIVQHIEDYTGDLFYILKVDEIVNLTTVMVHMVALRISGKGTPTITDDCQYYDDVNVTKVGTIKSCSIPTKMSSLKISGYPFKCEEPFHTGLGCSFGNLQGPVSGGKVGVVRSIHAPKTASGLLSYEAVYELLGGGQIGRVGIHWTGYVGNTETFVITPGYGQGFKDKTIKNGNSGIVTKFINLSAGQDIFANVVNEVTLPDSILGFSNIIKSQWTVYFQEMKDVVLSGKNYDIPAGYIDLRTIDPSPANKTFYVYLEYYEGKVGYKIYKDVKPESASRGLIANVTCGATQIATVTPWNRFSLDGVTWNINRAGSSIPVSVGTQFEIGNNGSFFNTNDYLPE